MHSSAEGADAIFFVTRPTRCTIFANLFLAWNSTCFGQFVCPSSGVYSLYTQQWCMSYRFVDSFRAGAYAPAVKHNTIAECTVKNSWWWTDELSETCRVSCQNKFMKLVHLVGFIIKKFVTMHGHMNEERERERERDFMSFIGTILPLPYVAGSKNA